jgi:hypothetical protein
MNTKRVCWRAGASLVAALLSACAMNYDPAEITVYHGQGNSQAVSYEIGDQGRRASSQRDLSVELPVGTRVCMNVLNAHTPGFSYAMQVSVDSTPPTPPSFGGLLSLLSAVIPGAGTETAAALSGTESRVEQARSALRARGASAPNSGVLESVIDDYQLNLGNLERDLRDAKDAIRLSLFPETLLPAQFQTATDEERGIRYAQRVISHLDSDSGRFNDPKLQETIKGWKDAAMASVSGFPEDEKQHAKLVIDALDRQAQTLLATRDAVRDTYLRATTSWRECKALTSGTSTMMLRALPRLASDFEGQRDTGKIVQVTAVSNFQRNALEIVPLAFVAFPHNVTGFAIVNDTVAENVKYADNAAFRVGTMVTATPLRFGQAAEWAFGPGIGTGIIGGDKPALSDFFLGGLLSWRDWLRVGGGYGFSQAPARLINGAAVGKPLPLGNGRESLNDFIENKRVGTWFLSFTFSGLKIKVPGT